jgi:hypothetical protein
MRLADGAAPHHRVLTARPVDYGPGSGNDCSAATIRVREAGIRCPKAELRKPWL